MDATLETQDPQTEELQKQFQGIAKLKQSYEVQGKALGFDPNMLKSMSAGELQGFVDGMKLKAAISHATAQEANTRMLTAVHAQALKAALGNEESNQALEGLAKQYGSLTAGGETPQEGDFANEVPPNVTPGMDPKKAMAIALAQNPKAARSAQLDNLIRALQSSKDYLPLGQTVQIPGAGMLIGTGSGQPHFAAAAAPEDGTWVTDKTSGKRFFLYGKAALPSGEDPAIAKPKKIPAGNYPFVMDEDPKKFLAGIKTIQDPAERDRILALRISVNHALGKTDEVAEAMKKILQPDQQKADAGKGFWDRLGGVFSRSKKEELPAGTPALPAATTEYRKGQRAVQNGVTYEFDGKDWKPASK